ncbi:MAG: sugar phosphate isomerase/epimerase [Planctomycetota bacterium]
MASCIGAQLYTVREFTQTPKDIAETLRKVREIGYEAVQVSGFGPIDKAELKRILDGEGLTCAATHIGFNEMRDEFERVVDEHKTLDCRYPAIGGMPGDYRNEEGYHRFAKDASEVAARFKEHGMTFGYHNHSWELQKCGEQVILGLLMAECSEGVTFEIDTYWIQHGGGCPATWIQRAAGRIPLLHLKDMAIQDGEQIMAEVGEGNLDWDGILAAAADAGTEWYLVEQDTCQRDPFESLGISLRNLKAMGLE